MSVQFQHPLYSEHLPKWVRCRDAASGQDAVHAAGTSYLPKLKDQSDDDYKAYRGRAVFFNASWRTISGLTGMLFRKPVKVEAPAITKTLLDTVTEDGQPIGIFAREVVEECLKVGRAGVLVDYPDADPDTITKADAALLNLRPTMAVYQAENIINWKQAVIANRRVLTMVVLVENDETSVDEFESKIEKQFRVLDLLSVDGVLQYRIRLFKIDETTKAEQQIGEDVFPAMNGKQLAFIPFYFLSADDTCAEPDDPPLIDLVDLNLSHYRTTADYEHGCHFTGLPTGYVTGYTPEENAAKMYLGSATMLTFPDPNAKLGFLEFSGQGLDALKANLDRKETQMAVLGARMLEQQKKAAESAEAAGIHRAGENSMLADVAQAISLGLTAALQTFSDWAGGNGKATLELNRDFFPRPMSAQEMTALVTSWQQGAISPQTLFDNLQAGQIIAEGKTFEEEQVQITDQMITAPSAPVAEPIEPEGKPVEGELLNAEPDTMQAEHNAAMLQASADQTASIVALAEAIANTPAPIVNVPAAVINLPEHPAPVINMPAITVESPTVNVAPAAITVNMPEQAAAPAQSFSFPAPAGGKDKVVTFKKDEEGKIIGADIKEMQTQGDN